MKTPVLIFDFDGTIADTHSRMVEISNLLSKEFNYKFIHPQDVENLRGKTSQEVIQILNIPMLKLPSIIAKAKRELYDGINSIAPIHGIKDILDQLKQHEIKIGILSSNSLENIVKFLHNHGIHAFDFIHTTSKIWSKNTSLKKLIHKNNFTHEEVIYVGDEVRDIEAAKKLGVKVAAVAWGYNSAQTLKNLKPDFMLYEPKDLLNLLSF